MLRLTLFTLVLLAAGCGLFVDDDSDLGGFASLEEYEEVRLVAVAALEEAIGDAGASALSACRTVAVGAKACGGPTSYAVYSTEAGDPAAVVQLAHEIRLLDERANRQFGLVSTCELTPEPEVVLADGQCRAK